MTKKINLSDIEDLIKKDHEQNSQKHTKLNELFRQLLKEITSSLTKLEDYDQLMDSLNYVKTGRKYTRSELND